nr:hypothetical protein FVER53263_10670 [Fusarium verticillioides]
MSEMILQATFAQKPRHSPDLLGDADRLQSACGKECQVDIIANNLRVTLLENVHTVGNQTPYSLKPNGQYAYWGETVSGPDTIQPYSTGSGGVFQASSVPLVGSAAISGYTIANPAIWFGFLGSDPDFSTEDNKACVAMSTTHLTITKDTYSHMYSANVTRLTQPVPRGKLDLTCSIGSADDCVATFTLTFNGGTVVTGEALGSDVLEEK